MAGIPWAESYLGQLRALAGERPLLFVGARAIVRDDQGRVLLIKRSDNGRWALPAGAMELGESITDCGARELYEETGLRAAGLTPYALYTGPAYTFTNMYADTYQLFMVAFRVDGWAGELRGLRADLAVRQAAGAVAGPGGDLRRRVDGAAVGEDPGDL